MHIRLAVILCATVLAGAMGSARAADLAVDAPSAGCNCGSSMIVVYDFQPGVVTRNWKTDCECRYVPYTKRFRQVATAPAYGPHYEPIVEPWRRN